MTNALRDIIGSYEHAALVYPHINYLKIPVTCIKPTIENANLFNNILNLLRLDKTFHPIIRTKSHGISISLLNLLLPAYDYNISAHSAEITILDVEGMWRIQFRSGVYEDEKNSISGRKAFHLFMQLLKKDGVDIEKYAVDPDTGLSIKETIEPPLITMENAAFKDVIFQNVHHIDFHNSYPGGLANTHPEFRPTIEMCYNKRKKDEKYKAILNLSIGFMQSKWCGYKYASLSRNAIADNKRRVKLVSKALKEGGRAVLAYNTDGIWYCGDIYHGELEGNNIGEWSNDHINCQFRMKSKGAYEYIDGEGHYHPVVRGYTKLDQIKDRSEWHWGDIYQADVVKFLITERGIEYFERSKSNEN